MHTQVSSLSPTNQRGITVLALVLIIIAVILVAFFLVSYLRTTPGPSQSMSIAPAQPTASTA
jgi:PDZ domain-containing secreted protein